MMLIFLLGLFKGEMVERITPEGFGFTWLPLVVWAFKSF
jgi:hypothetical protein